MRDHSLGSFATSSRFPPSDHCDGDRFHNPGARPPVHGIAALLRWRAGRPRAAWRAPVERPIFPPPPSAVADGDAAITFINHSTFLVRIGGVTLLTDPIFSDRCSPLSWAGPKRIQPPGIPLERLPRPDIVLLSHNHYDHMDLPSLRLLNAIHAPSFVTMLGNAWHLESAGIEAVELDWWQATIVAGLRVTATPARHFSARGLFDRNRALWGGFMIDAQAGRILFAGDSGAGPHWREIRSRLSAPGLALLPIGAYEPRWFMAPVHMDPAEAVQAHLDLGALRSIGMHFGTFQLTDEAIDAPAMALARAASAANLDAAEFSTLGFGETRLLSLSA